MVHRPVQRTAPGLVIRREAEAPAGPREISCGGHPSGARPAPNWPW